MLKDSKPPIGLVVGTGMQDFLQSCATGSWKYRSPGPRKSMEVFEGTISYDGGDVPIVAISRHGRDPNKIVRPHEIDHAANMLMLYRAGARRVLATSAVGVAYAEYLGKLIVPTDLYDASGRVHSLSPEEGELHAGLSEPFDLEMRKSIEEAVKELGMEENVITRPHPGKAECLTRTDDQETSNILANSIIYHQTNGPNFEPRAYTAAWKMLGADLFGMTAVSECIVAHNIGKPVGEGDQRRVEEKMGYAVIGLGTNLCAHMAQRIVHEEHITRVRKMEDDLVKLLREAARRVYQSQPEL